MSRICPAPGCRTPITPRQRRCPAHNQRHAYRDPAYQTIRNTLRAHGAACATCGSMTDLTIDHITPLTAGGTNHPTNLQVLCRPCNSRKGGASQGTAPPPENPFKSFRTDSQVAGGLR